MYSNVADDVEYDFQLINIDSGEESKFFILPFSK